MSICRRASGNAASFQRTRSDTVISTGLDYSTCHRVDEDTLSSLAILRLPQSTLHPRSMSEGYQCPALPVDNQTGEGFDFSTAKSIAKSLVLQADGSVEASLRIWSMGLISNTDFQKSQPSTESSIPVLKRPTQHTSNSLSIKTTVRHNDNNESSNYSQVRGQEDLTPTIEAVDDHIRVIKARSCSDTSQVLHSESRGGQTQRTALYVSQTHQSEEQDNPYVERIPSSYHSATSHDTFLAVMKCRDVTKGYRFVRDVPMIAGTGTRKTHRDFLSPVRSCLGQADRSFQRGSLLDKPPSDILPHEGTSTISCQCLRGWWFTNTLDNKEKLKSNQAIFRCWFRGRSLRPYHISNQHTDPTRSTLQASKSRSPVSWILKLPFRKDSSNSFNSAQRSLGRLTYSIRDEISSRSSQSTLIITREDNSPIILKNIPLSAELTGTSSTDIYTEKKPHRQSRCCMKPLIDKFRSSFKHLGQVDSKNQAAEMVNYAWAVTSF